MNYPKRHNITVIVCLLPLLLTAQLSIKADRPTAQYAVGESMNFIVTGATAAVNYEIKYALESPFTPLSTGTLTPQNGQISIPFTFNDTNLVVCHITSGAETAWSAATFAPLSIQPKEPAPMDFDSFWTAQKSLLAQIPLNTNITFKRSNDFSDTYDFDIGVTDGKRIYGYMVVPRGMSGRIPAVIQLPPYGTGADIVQPDLTVAERGGVISIFLNIHQNLPSVPASNPNYLLVGTDHPQNYYLKHALLGVVKTVDYLQTRPDFNGQVGAIGVSQGGGLAILAAGIEPRISLLVTVFAALSEHSGLKYGKPSGFPRFWSTAPTQGLAAQSVLSTVKYYDAVYAANRFKGVSWTMVAYKDEICLPATTLTAFNQLGGQKILQHELLKGHGDGPAEFFQSNALNGMYALFRRHFPPSRNAPFLWNPTTQGYLINAGRDTTVYNLNPLLLRGQVFVEQTENTTFAGRWEKVSGEGTVNFSQPNSRQTNVTFSKSGIYTLRFIAEDATAINTESKFFNLIDDIVIMVNMPIPVDLKHFKGKVFETENVLEWETASESQNKGFEIERSDDAKTWQKIAWLAGKGTTQIPQTYVFEDNLPPLSIAYYRLRQLDENGRSTLSKIVSLQRPLQPKIKVYPNPTTAFLTIQLDNTTDVTVKIIDILGKIWLTDKIESDQNSLNLKDLPKGNYLIEISKNGLVLSREIIYKN